MEVILLNLQTNAHFAVNPVDIEMQRSKFSRPSQHKTTFNTGDLVPIYVDEVLPGDTFSMDMAAAIRMTTPIFPVMDNASADFYFFFVPNRLIWQHWKQFQGENTQSFWEQPIDYEIPQLTAPEGGWNPGTIADYMGIPTKVSNLSVNALPFRAYCLIWNEWFRDQNVMQPAEVSLEDGTQQGSNENDFTNSYITKAQLGAAPLKVAKYHDYFTSCLPAPQKGPDVLLPIGDFARIYPDDSKAPDPIGYTVDSVRFSLLDGGSSSSPRLLGVYSDGSSDGSYLASADGPSAGNFFQKLYPYNLIADLSNATASTISQLRQAFAIQRLYEKDARGGTRYTEMIKAHFGVTSPDARQQRPEYLGGTRLPISMDQVLQTSGTTDTSPQGNTAAYSLTNMVDSVFTKSFTEHGYIIGLCAVRTQHTYQQGLEKMWSRKSRFDFYMPALANISEQPVYKKEILATGTRFDDSVFGYQEAWADYRYKPSRVSGTFRSNVQASLDSWHYADYYGEPIEGNIPTLSADWMFETTANVDRTLTVPSATENQFIADFYFKLDCVRPMPLYSIPGLIDHY